MTVRGNQSTVIFSKNFCQVFMVLLVLFIFCLLPLFFFVAFPNKEKGGVLTCDRLLYTQINQLSCLFWQRFTFFEDFSGVIFFCLITKLQHESSSTLAPVIFATLNYLDYYHETSKQLSLWDLVCYCLLLIFPQKMSTVEVWFWLRWLKISTYYTLLNIFDFACFIPSLR